MEIRILKLLRFLLYIILLRLRTKLSGGLEHFNLSLEDAFSSVDATDASKLLNLKYHLSMKPRGYLDILKGMLEPRVRMYSVAKASAGWIRGISPSFTERKNVLWDSQSGSKILMAGRLLHHLFVLLLLHFLSKKWRVWFMCSAIGATACCKHTQSLS